MPSLPLECFTETRSGALVMRVRGEIDLWTAETLRLEIDPVVRSGSPVVVDLREVSYLDGAGFRVLAEASRICSSHDQPMCVIPSPIVSRLLALLRLEDVFVVRESLEGALELLGTRR